MSGRQSNGAEVQRLERALAELCIVSERVPRFLRFADAQRELGCSKNHLRNLIRRGVLTAVKLDGLLLLQHESYAAYLDRAVAVEPRERTQSSRGAA